MTMTNRVSIKSKRPSKEVSHRLLFGGLKLFSKRLVFPSGQPVSDGPR